MKTIKLSFILLSTVILMSQCSREDDTELYKAYYQSPADSVKLDSKKFMIEPSEINQIGDTVGFKYDDAGQVLTWVVSLNQKNSMASTDLEFVAKSLKPAEHFWLGENENPSVPFDTINDILVTVKIFNSDVTFPGGTIKFK